MNSMTAFSRLQLSLDELVMIWEIKTVNHRFLDQSYRLPENIRAIEATLRPIVAKHLTRGRVEISLQFKNQSTSKLPMLNEKVLEKLVELSLNISSQYPIQNTLNTSDILNWPGIWNDDNHGFSELEMTTIVDGFKQALISLVACRQQEGLAIQNILFDKLENLQEHITQIMQLTQDASPRLKDKLYQKINAWMSGTFDPQRLEQELVVQMMRVDITEELDRLATHVSEMKRVIADEKNNGRRLDFLTQELHRETNTIGSKTDLKEISQLVIDMKVFIEQMREQIQNVE